MTTIELPAGVEHGTPEGYAAGCHKDTGCPALHTHGMACVYAHVRSTTDVRYYKAKVRNPDPAAIAAVLGIKPPGIRDVEKDAAIDEAFDERHGDYRYRPGRPHRDRKPTAAQDAAQPLAERANDTDPQEDAGVPAIETETPAEVTPVVEAEAMGHPTTTTPNPTEETPTMPTPADVARKTPKPRKKPEPPTLTTDKWTAGLSRYAKTKVLAEIRDWCRTNGYPGTPTHGRIPQDALAAYDAAHDPVSVESGSSDDALTTTHGGGTIPIVIGETVPLRSSDILGAADKGKRRKVKMTEPTEPLEPAEYAESLEQLRDRIDPLVPETLASLKEQAIAAIERGEAVAFLLDVRGTIGARRNIDTLAAFGCTFYPARIPENKINDDETRDRPATVVSNTHAGAVCKQCHQENHPGCTGRLHGPMGGAQCQCDCPASRFLRNNTGDAAAPDQPTMMRGALRRIDEEPAGNVIDIRGHRPDWADVTVSEDVERARSLAVRLEQELAEVTRQRDEALAERDAARWALGKELDRNVERPQAGERPTVDALEVAIHRWWVQVEENNHLRLRLAAEQLANQVIRGTDYAIASLRRRENRKKGRR